MSILSLLILGLATQVSAISAPDEIDKCIAESVPKHSESWLNGAFQPINLPSDASASAIIYQVVQQSGYKDGNRANPFKNYRIIEVKKIAFSDAPGTYTAILIASAKGSKTLILAQYNSDGWWHRSFFVTTVP